MARRKPSDQFHRLDPDRIALTAGRLASRVAERFPGSGLAQVADELASLAKRAGRDTRTLSRPSYPLRAAVAVVIVVGLLGQLWAVSIVDWWNLGLIGDPLAITPVIESAVNLLLLMFAGAWFLMTLEQRLRRGRVQRWMHRLRSFAHVIDMHQLTKDPTVLLRPPPRTPSSPERRMDRVALARYLDYCAEMLAVTGKLSALMAGESDDHVIIAGASDVENLCTDLGRKVWQKIMILGELAEPAAPDHRPGHGGHHDGHHGGHGDHHHGRPDQGHHGHDRPGGGHGQGYGGHGDNHHHQGDQHGHGERPPWPERDPYYQRD